MASEKTQVRGFRLKTSTIQAIDALAKSIDRKPNWYVQRVLDKHIESKINQKQTK